MTLHPDNLKDDTKEKERKILDLINDNRATDLRLIPASNFNFLIKTSYNLLNPLTYAITVNKRLEIIEILLLKLKELGDIDKKQDQFPPLFCAIILQKKEIVNLLISSGADINYKNLSGDTPLSFAIKKNNLDIADLLIRLGANPNTPIGHNPNIPDKDRETPLKIVINKIKNKQDKDIKYDSLIKSMIQYSRSYKIYQQIKNTLSKELEKNIDILSAFAPTLDSIAEEKDLPLPQPKEASASSFNLEKHQFKKQP